jgi:hypothetical protein
MTCEYKPNEKRKLVWDHENAHAQAVWVCGTGKNNIHLCDSCSNLPQFKDLEKKPLERGKP